MRPYEALKQIADIHTSNYKASLELQPGTVEPGQCFLDGFYAALQWAGIKAAFPEPNQKVIPVGALEQKMAEWKFPMDTAPANWASVAPSDPAAHDPPPEHAT